MEELCAEATLIPVSCVYSTRNVWEKSYVPDQVQVLDSGDALWVPLYMSAFMSKLKYVLEMFYYFKMIITPEGNDEM